MINVINASEYVCDKIITALWLTPKFKLTLVKYHQMKHSINAASIYWHDYETFGTNAKTDRPVQFAGIRTDLDLNIIGDPLVIYCKPAMDFLPDPRACLVTGITPQHALEHGLLEADFIKKILAEFSKPNTCVSGYNSIRFDDEFTRYTLYRNLYDAYAREWQNGNSRWDIIDLVRVCYALRPDGINWPMDDNGQVSFRLEKLTAENNIQHSDAHDALSDVKATIAMAKLIKDKQPKLYDYYFQHRNKRLIANLLDIEHKKPVLHTSSMFPVEYACTALVAPLASHPTNTNGIISYDLRYNPTDLLALPVDDIIQRLYTRTQDLPEGMNRIALKTIHLNKCPVVVPAKLDDFTTNRLQINKQQAHEHLQILREASGLKEKLIRIFEHNPFDEETDADYQLYGGNFFSNTDKKQMEKIHRTKPSELQNLHLYFEDERLDSLFFRFRARNYFDTLGDEEKQDWLRFIDKKLADLNYPMNRENFKSIIETIRSENSLDEKKLQIVNQLTAYEKMISTRLSDQLENVETLG